MGTADYSSAQSTLLALMNSAPAELLHPLIDAALQPLLTRVFSPVPRLGRKCSQYLAAAILGQKNASG
ncbi:hypothetical protein CPter291_4654 [Collimonas pratensis]|uniref:Uncharacterized protein n=1 Tax=Collimonas pratensis TaxID=279113 RepID=A0A127QAT6_9BURK|nr:hypothetical protein CPter91_4840 [Collimonas pratensis]AMP16873.1 hypothetical protein CPter291_4654 [Collimonas pratensis]